MPELVEILTWRFYQSIVGFKVSRKGMPRIIYNFVSSTSKRCDTDTGPSYKLILAYCDEVSVKLLANLTNILSLSQHLIPQ